MMPAQMPSEKQQDFLLDANMLIASFDQSKHDDEVEKQRRVRIEAMIKAGLRLWTTPLSSFEALRKSATPDAMQVTLQKWLRYVDIGEKHAIRAAEVFRYARQTGYTDDWLDKRRFDIFFYVCAEVEDMKPVSGDEKRDIDKIKTFLIQSRQH